MDYQEKILELAKKEGLQVCKGMLLENVYNELFLKLAKDNNDLKAENDCLKQKIESKSERIDELKGDIIALNKDIDNIFNDNKELNKAIDFKNNCFYELSDKHVNLEKENKNSLEIIDNYRKGIENSNIEIAELKGLQEKLEGEIVNLKQLLKAVTYLL